MIRQHTHFYRHAPICIFVTLLACLILANTAGATDAEFLGRDLYPSVNVIELGVLKKTLDSVVDVRSAYKYRTLHIKNARADDAGITDWTKQYPKDSQQLSKILNNPKLLISKTRFSKYLLRPDHVANNATRKKYIVLNIRDRLQRGALALLPSRKRREYFSTMADAFLGRT